MNKMEIEMTIIDLEKKIDFELVFEKLTSLSKEYKIPGQVGSFC